MTALSTESIASSTQPVAGATAQCASCGSALAADQRYCLECGERRVLPGNAAPAAPAGVEPPVAPTPPRPPSAPPAERGNNTTAVIAGVGVLLLAMGVGVLIGRAGNPKQAAAPATQVVTVAGAGTGAGTGTAASEPSFSDDWPSGTSGYTVQLQTLPQPGTSTSAVQAAKTAAGGKGAKAVGALESEDFSSLSAGHYVIYAGVYHKRGEAVKALAGLRRSFPAAKVIAVNNGGSSAEGSQAGGSSGGVGSNENKPAPPSVLEGLKGAKGKSYEEKSKNLPNVVSTG